MSTVDVVCLPLLRLPIACIIHAASAREDRATTLQFPNTRYEDAHISRMDLSKLKQVNCLRKKPL